MASGTDIKVHLDHLIQRESLRWVNPSKNKDIDIHSGSKITTLRYNELGSVDSGFSKFNMLRKPDFQRETSAWNPEDCLTLLESIVNNLIIPSLILWRSPENNLLYILDGAHRVSVMRAWMVDDWGDRAPEGYYERHEYIDEIKSAARHVRDLVKRNIGSYEDYATAGGRFMDATRKGSPRELLSSEDFARGFFYTSMAHDMGFHIQEIIGDYDIAEKSFLRINKSGQPLNDWETKLIENRNSSFARAVMSVAKAGVGRYWPEDESNPALTGDINSIKTLSYNIHNRLFVPPFQAVIKDANVPFIASSQYFPKHAYLLELFPIIMKTANIEDLFAKDKGEISEVIVRNGKEILENTHLTFRHLMGESNDSLSMSIVPLFYFYTDIGRYVRSSLYGLITWIMSGSDDDIKIRKLLFSAHRGAFERVLFSNDVAGAITRRAGSGPRAIEATVKFYQRLLALLIESKSDLSSAEFERGLNSIMTDLTTPSQRKTQGKSRAFTVSQKAKINLKYMFDSAMRCEICGGIIDLRKGTQYDHTIAYSVSKVTDADTGRPTHPFCNNNRVAIEEIRVDLKEVDLPAYFGIRPLGGKSNQPSLFDLFDSVSFPDDEP